MHFHYGSTFGLIAAYPTIIKPLWFWIAFFWKTKQWKMSHLAVARGHSYNEHHPIVPPDSTDILGALLSKTRFLDWSFPVDYFVNSQWNDFEARFPGELTQS